MIGARAWQWGDTTHDGITSVFTLVRFGAGTLSDGATETRFAHGEALIEEPTHQCYETFSGPRVGPASVPSRVNITLHGAGEAPGGAFLNRSTCSLTAAGCSAAGMFLVELNAGATWAARGVAGKAVVGVQARHGLPPKRAEEGS